MRKIIDYLTRYEEYCVVLLQNLEQCSGLGESCCDGLELFEFICIVCDMLTGSVFSNLVL